METDRRKRAKLACSAANWRRLEAQSMSRPDMKNYLFALILMCCPQSSSAADSVEEIRAIRAEMNVGFNTQPRNFDFISTRLTENFTLIGPAGRFASPRNIGEVL